MAKVVASIDTMSEDYKRLLAEVEGELVSLNNLLQMLKEEQAQTIRSLSRGFKGAADDFSFVVEGSLKEKEILKDSHSHELAVKNNELMELKESFAVEVSKYQQKQEEQLLLQQQKVNELLEQRETLLKDNMSAIYEMQRDREQLMNKFTTQLTDLEHEKQQLITSHSEKDETLLKHEAETSKSLAVLKVKFDQETTQSEHMRKVLQKQIADQQQLINEMKLERDEAAQAASETIRNLQEEKLVHEEQHLHKIERLKTSHLEAIEQLRSECREEHKAELQNTIEEHNKTLSDVHQQHREALRALDE